MQYCKLSRLWAELTYLTTATWNFYRCDWIHVSDH